MSRPTGPWDCTCASHTSNLSDAAALSIARILYAVRQREAASEAAALAGETAEADAKGNRTKAKAKR